MASIKVELYKWKTLKNGEHPIILQVIQNRKRKIISLGYSCSVALWDVKKHLPKKKHPLFGELSVAIIQKKLEASRVILEFDTENKEYSSQEVLKQIKHKSNQRTVTVFGYFDETYERLKKSGRIGYANVFKDTKRAISKFQSEKDLHFTDIDFTFLSRFDESFAEKGVSPNSVFVYMRALKTLINNAKKENLIKETFNPFKDFSFSKYKRIKTVKRAITREQMQLIIDFIPGNNSLINSKNYFMFSYYCRGINFTDIAFLKWSNINDKRLEYTRKKTKEFFSMEILDPALKIIRYYKKTNYSGEDSYIFPILNSFHQTPQQIDNRIEKIIKQTNKDLKTIAEKVGIKENLTTYVARHSFATIMKRSGVSTSVISESMGHDSETTTQIYLDSFENKVLDEANKALL